MRAQRPRGRAVARGGSGTRWSLRARRSRPVGAAGDVVGCVWGPAAGGSASVDTVGPDEHAPRMHAQANMPITGMRCVRVIVTMPDRSPLVSLGAPDSVGPSAPAARGRPLAVRLLPGAAGPVGCSGRVEVRHRNSWTSEAPGEVSEFTERSPSLVYLFTLFGNTGCRVPAAPVVAALLTRHTRQTKAKGSAHEAVRAVVQDQKGSCRCRHIGGDHPRFRGDSRSGGWDLYTLERARRLRRLPGAGDGQGIREFHWRTARLCHGLFGRRLVVGPGGFGAVLLCGLEGLGVLHGLGHPDPAQRH